MAINLLSDAKDASADSHKCKAALIYVLLNGTPPLANKFEIDEDRDSLKSEGIPVDICEVAKAKELNLELLLSACIHSSLSPMLITLRIVPGGELVLNVAKGQDGAGPVGCRSCYEVVCEFNKRNPEKEWVLYNAGKSLQFVKIIMCLDSSHCSHWFGFTKETDDSVREWNSIVVVCHLSRGRPSFVVKVSEDAYKTIQVLSSRRKSEDRTMEIMRCGIEPSLDRNMQHILWPSPPSEQSAPLRGYYRIVFKEVSESVLFTRNSSDLSAAFSDAVKVLRYIHGCGYVQRDTSVGNMYLFEGRGLLEDLEYANLKLDDPPHELRTGTLDFMAVEAIRRRYYFDTKDTADTEEKVKCELLQKAEGKAACEDYPTDINLPFFHNDLHDMESLWWIAIWKLFFHRDKTQPEIDDEIIATRQTASYKLFPRYLTTEHRREFLRSLDAFRKMLGWLHTSLAKISGHLHFLRLHLHNRYQEFERRFPEYTFENFQGVQTTFQTHFEFCRRYATGVELAPFKTTGLQGAKSNTGVEGWQTQMPPVVTGQSMTPAHASEAPSMSDLGSATVTVGSSSSSSLGKRKVVDDLTPFSQLT